MRYLITAKDGTDADAPARRQGVSEKQLEGIRDLATSGRLQGEDALHDDDGIVTGPMLLLGAASEEATGTSPGKEFFTRSGTWQSVGIHPFGRAV